jgi:phage protein D
VSDQAIPLYQGDNFYVPKFEVKLGPRPLEREVVNDILTVSYKDSVEDIDSFDITINNWDAQKREFKYVDSSKFDPGKKLELWMGYHGQYDMRRMITGEITSLQPAFPASGGPTLVISGLSLLHSLRKKQESHTYERLTDSRIAQQIGTRLGVTMVTRPGTEETYDYLLQDNQYDIVFLMQRARRVGYDLFVQEEASGSSIYFGPSQNVSKVAYKLKYGASLIEFKPTLSTANQVGKVTVRGWDNKQKRKIEATVTRQQLATKGVGAAANEGEIENAFATREEVITDKPVATEQEARTLAKETLENIAKDMIKGSGSTVGLPDLRAGSIVLIEGLGKRFSGRYFVNATTHTIGDGGYTTQFECRKEELR